MTKERNALKAGIFIIVSLVLVGFVVVAISGSNQYFQPHQLRTVSFKLTDDIGGLRIGDDVRIGGFKVGEVRTIDVEEPATGMPASRVVVTFTMPSKYSLHKNARVSIQSTVTGTSNLNFDNLGSGPALADSDELVGYPGTFTELLDDVHAIEPHVTALIADAHDKTLPLLNDDLARFGKTADSGTALADDLKAQVHPVVEHYNNVTDHATQMMDQIRDLIGDTKTDFRGTVANLNASTGSIKDKLPAILDQVNKLVVTVDDKVNSAAAALDDIRAITSSTRGILGGNRGKIDGMIASLKTTGDNLKNASAEIRRSPWRLLYKPAAGEMGNLNLYDSAREFAEGANNLNDAAEALRDTLKTNNPDKEQVQKLMDQVDKSFGNFKQVEDKLWTSVKE